MTSRFPRNSTHAHVYTHTLVPRKTIYKHTCCSYDAQIYIGEHEASISALYIRIVFFCPLSLFSSVIQTDTHTRASERAHILWVHAIPTRSRVQPTTLQLNSDEIPDCIKYEYGLYSNSSIIKTTEVSEHIIIIIVIILCTHTSIRNNVSEMGCSIILCKCVYQQRSGVDENILSATAAAAVVERNKNITCTLYIYIYKLPHNG